MSLRGEYAPFSFWEGYLRVYLELAYSEPLIYELRDVRNTLVLTGDQVVDIIHLFGGDLNIRRL